MHMTPKACPWASALHSHKSFLLAAFKADLPTDPRPYPSSLTGNGAHCGCCALLPDSVDDLIKVLFCFCGFSSVWGFEFWVLGFGFLDFGVVLLLGFYVLFRFVSFLIRNKGQDSLCFCPRSPLRKDSQSSKTQQMKWNSNKVGYNMNMCLSEWNFYVGCG